MERRDGCNGSTEGSSLTTPSAGMNTLASGTSSSIPPAIATNLMYNQMLSNCNNMPLNLAELYKKQNYFPPATLNQMGQVPPTMPVVPPFVLGPSNEQIAMALHSKMFGYTNAKEKKNVLRKGKWTLEEENYTNKIIEMFNNSLLQLPSESNGITLRTYLAEKLNCDPMRITKKYAGASCLGKRVYHATLNNKANSEVLAKVQAELAELEMKFKEKIDSISADKETVKITENNTSGKVRTQNPLLPWPMGYQMQMPPVMGNESVNQVPPGMLINSCVPGASKVGMPLSLFPGVVIPPATGEGEKNHQYNYLSPYFQSLYSLQPVPKQNKVTDGSNHNSTSSDSRNSDSRSDSSTNSHHNEKNKKSIKEPKMSARMSTTSSSSAATTKSSSNRDYTHNGTKESNSESGSGRGSGSRGSGSRGSGSGSDGDRGSGSGNCSDEGSRSGSGSDGNGDRSHQPLSNQSLIQHNQINEHKNFTHGKGGGATSSDKSSSEKSSGDDDNFNASDLLVGFINHVHSVSQNALSDPNLVSGNNRRNAVLAAAAAATAKRNSPTPSYSGSDDDSGVRDDDQDRKRRKGPSLSREVIAVLRINPSNPG